MLLLINSGILADKIAPAFLHAFWHFTYLSLLNLDDSTVWSGRVCHSQHSLQIKGKISMECQVNMERCLWPCRPEQDRSRLISEVKRVHSLHLSYAELRQVESLGLCNRDLIPLWRAFWTTHSLQAAPSASASYGCSERSYQWCEELKCFPRPKCKRWAHGRWRSLRYERLVGFFYQSRIKVILRMKGKQKPELESDGYSHDWVVWHLPAESGEISQLGFILGFALLADKMSLPSPRRTTRRICNAYKLPLSIFCLPNIFLFKLPLGGSCWACLKSSSFPPLGAERQ